MANGSAFAPDVDEFFRLFEIQPPAGLGAAGAQRFMQAYLRDPAKFTQLVREGLLKERGMFAFGAELSEEDVAQIRAYVIHRAHETRQKPGAGSAQKPKQ